MQDLQQAFIRVTQPFGLTDQGLLEALIECSSIELFDKEQPLVSAGNHPTHYGFILKGMMRYYYTSSDGKERNKSFFTENHAVGSLSAMTTGQPSPYTIEALEDSEILLTPTSIVDAFQDRFPQFRSLMFQITQQMFLRNERREAMLLTLNAEQRYQWLLQQEPEIAQRVPQYHLASYLGMDAVSLSRIRRKLKRG